MKAGTVSLKVFRRWLRKKPRRSNIATKRGAKAIARAIRADLMSAPPGYKAAGARYGVRNKVTISW